MTQENIAPQDDAFDLNIKNSVADMISVVFKSKDNERRKKQYDALEALYKEYDDVVAPEADTAGTHICYNFERASNFFYALRKFARENMDVVIYIRSFIRVEDFVNRAIYTLRD